MPYGHTAPTCGRVEIGAYLEERPLPHRRYAAILTAAPRRRRWLVRWREEDVGSLRSSLPGDLLGGNGILLDFHVMRHPGEPRHRWPPWVLAGPRTSPIWRARSAPARSGQRRCAQIGQIDCPAQLKAPHSTPNARVSVILCPAGLLWGVRHWPGGALR